MPKTMWKPGTFLYPIPAVMVSCGTIEKSNIITVAWTGIINTDPAIVYISVRPTRFSYDIIKKSKEFVINLTDENLVYAVDWCGVKTGKNLDKFKEMKLTKERAEFIKCPMIREASVSIECKVIEIKELGSHHMFIAKVLAIHADNKFIDKNGAFDISKCNLVAYANGGYYSLGKKYGKFGFSVQKRKSKAVEIKNAHARNTKKGKNVKKGFKKNNNSKLIRSKKHIKKIAKNEQKDVDILGK